MAHPQTRETYSISSLCYRQEEIKRSQEIQFTHQFYSSNNLTTSKSADTIATRRLPTCYRFTLDGYSEIDPVAVVVAEIPVVAESTEVDKGASGLKLCDYTKIHKVHLNKEKHKKPV